MGTTTELGDEVTVTAGAFGDGPGWPVFVRPATTALAADLDAAAAWMRVTTPALGDLLSQVGAVVLRGFPITGTDAFNRLIADLPGSELGYAGGTTSRRNLGGRVYEATAAPVTDLAIPLHQEMAYARTYPTKLAFFCHTPARTGGSTTVGDVRRLEARIPGDLREAVQRHGVRYRRHLRSPGTTTGSPMLDPHHKTWSDTFYTESRSEVERICAATGLEWMWHDDGSMTTECLTEGYATHPLTGERHWFSHVHPMASIIDFLGQAYYEEWDRYYNAPDAPSPRPYEVCLGDGSPIDPALTDPLFPLYREATIAFPWQSGDVMFVDNIIVAHGRSPYTGPRDVQVALFSGW